MVSAEHVARYLAIQSLPSMLETGRRYARHILDIRAEKEPGEVLVMRLEHRHCLESGKIGSLVVDLPYIALSLYR